MTALPQDENPVDSGSHGALAAACIALLSLGLTGMIRALSRPAGRTWLWRPPSGAVVKPSAATVGLATASPALLAVQRC